MNPSHAHTAPRELHLVTFRLDGWEYAVEVNDICGIYHGLAIIPTPDDSELLEGEVHLFAHRIPVINLRRVLNLGDRPSGPVWLLVLYQAGKQVGLLVDSVVEVLRLQSNALQPCDGTSHQNPASDFVTASVSHKERTIYLPDLQRLLGACPAS
jgi:chemotaxis signal transduction protein